MAGGGIALVSSAFPSGKSLLDEFFVLRFDRLMLSSASSPAPLVAEVSVVALDFVLGRLLGGLVESKDAFIFLCLLLVIIWGAESAASSPDASREEG